MATSLDVVLALRHMARAGASEKLLAAAAKELTLAALVERPADGSPESTQELPKRPLSASEREPEPSLRPAPPGNLTETVPFVRSASSVPPPIFAAPPTPVATPNSVGRKINFWDSAKRRNSIHIQGADWETLLKAPGTSEEALREAVKKLAPTAPEGSNRSQWVVLQLRKQYSIS